MTQEFFLCPLLMTYAYCHIFQILDFKTATIIEGTQSISILLVACIMHRFQNQPDVACKRGLIIVFEPIPELLEVACKRGLIIILNRFQKQPYVACKRGLIIVFSACNKRNGRPLHAGKLGLEWQNNNFARASRFFVHSFAVTARQRPENA